MELAKTRQHQQRRTAEANRPGIASPEFSVISAFEPGRKLTEDYIAGKFRACYGATLCTFMPELLVMHRGAISSGKRQDLDAALGLRRGADTCPFFLEHYLNSSAEQLLSSATQDNVARSKIAEIGNLVATRRGSSQLLFIALTALLCRQGIEWAMFTATPEVQKLLSRLKLKQIHLADADGSQLGEAEQDWGSYYHSKPAVIAVNAPQALRAISRHPLTAMMLDSCENQIDSLCHYGA